MRKWIAGAAIALFVGGVCRSAPAQDKVSELAIQIVQTKPGNVFVQGDAITFGIETGGESVKWIVQDFWRAQVLKGSSPVEGGRAQIVLPLKKFGYFTLRVTAERGGRSSTRETPFALLTPFDLTKAPDSPFGIGTHFCQAYTLKIIPLIALAGVKTTRDEHYWFLTEQEKGEYTFIGHKWHNELNRVGIKPFTVLGMDNRFYDLLDGKRVTPYTDAGTKGFARYGAAVAEHYGDQLQAVEVFNEYNVDFCKGPAASKPENYFKMLKATYDAVKAARPETVVVGCATSCLPWMWIEKVFELGGLNYMDVVSVHPYRWHRWNDLSPETLEPDMVKLTELIAKYNTTGKPRPIWDTEVSWPSGGEWVSEETQADYLVRTYIVSIASGVEKIYWYEMGGHSYPPDAPYRGWESGYAVLHHLKNPIGSLTPKPSFVSLAVMTRQLTGAEFVSRDKTEEWIRSYAFEKDGEPIRVMWSMQSGTVAVRVKAPVTVVDIMGEPVTLTPADGVVYLTLSGSPLYLKGRISGISPTRAVEVTGRAEAAMGDKLPVTLTVDMPGPFSGVFEVEGTTWEFSAEKGGKVTKTIVVDGSDVGGERKATYRLASGGKVIGMGSLNTTIQPRLTLSAGLEDPEHLAVWIRNSSATAECRLTTLNWRIGGREGGQKLSETLKPSGTRKLSIPFGAPQPYRIFPVSVVVTCPDRSKLEFKDDLSYSPCARRNVRIDGVLDEWQGPAIVLSKVGKVRAQGEGRPDVDGRVMIGWDNQFFYLAAEITDDIHHQTYPEEEEWRGDGLQFGLAWESSGYEFGAALTKQGVKISTFVAPMGFLANEFAKRAKTAVKRKGKTLVYELAIAWDSIPPISPKNGEFLFSFLVNDNDGRGREGWVEWASGIGGDKKLGFYQACRFVGR